MHFVTSSFLLLLVRHLLLLAMHLLLVASFAPDGDFHETEIIGRLLLRFIVFVRPMLAQVMSDSRSKSEQGNDHLRIKNAATLRLEAIAPR